MNLDTAELEHYREHGYLLLRGLFDADSLQRFDQRFIELANGAEKPERLHIMKDVMVAKGVVEPASPVHAVNKLFSFEEDPTLYAFTQHRPLVDAVCAVLGKPDDIYTLVTNVFNKPPGIDGRHPLHQDLKYFDLRPADGIVGVWTAIRPATRAAGCLAVVPGSHRGPLLEHKNPDWEYVNHAVYGVETDLGKRVHVEMQPGDTLLFHPLIIHGSGQNTTGGFRRAISTHYARGDCEVPNLDWRSRGGSRRVAV